MFVLFNAIDHACGALPVGARLGLYGLIVGVLAMLIYWLLAPQQRILAIRAEMADAQRALRAYNGTDPRQILRLSAKSISPALKQLLLLLLPTLIATAPVLLVMDWLESAYAYRLPSAGGGDDDQRRLGRTGRDSLGAVRRDQAAPFRRALCDFMAGD